MTTSAISMFERLPLGVVGNVLIQLNNVTGSKGIVNEADIPVIMRYANNLAGTSKRMYASVNDPTVTHLFLKSLADKYRNPPEHFAAQLNTIGARTWLWNYINKNGDSEVYQVIQDIYDLAARVLTEAKEAGLDFECSEGRTDWSWSAPQPDCYQTKRGFLLYNDWEPKHLATPFGQIRIFTGGWSSGNASLSVTEVFIKRLNASFDSVSCFGCNTIYEITASPNGPDRIRKIMDEEMKEISQQKLEGKRGTQNVIINPLYGKYSAYKLSQVGGRVLPDVALYDSKNDLRSVGLINRIWEMLEIAHLGQDPIPKKIEPMADVSQSHTVKVPMASNLAGVVQWGIDLVQRLAQQPIFQGQTFWGTPIKALPLKSSTEVHILEVLNTAAKKFLEENTEWPIEAFCNGSLKLNKENIGSGVKLHLDSSDNSKPCDLNTLAVAYKAVLNSLSLNWVRSELKDYPDISHTQSEEDYILFIKKNNLLLREHCLLRSLIDQLDLSKSIICKNDWKNWSPSDVNTSLYLWIRKDRLDQVTNILEFKFD